MPQLRSCYFCGAVGDSLREYDLAPDDLAPAGGSNSAVLCSTCHEKLRRILEPLTDEGSAGSEPEPSATRSITFGDGSDTSGPDDSAPTETDDAAGGDAGAKVDTDADAGAEGSEPSTAESDGSDASSSDDDPDVPDAYYKVLRLLQNREFPMERAALTALVTAAYDVSEPECERVIETAIERGVLIEDGATVDLGRN